MEIVMRDKLTSSGVHMDYAGLPSSLAHLLHARSPRIQASGRTGPKRKRKRTATVNCCYCGRAHGTRVHRCWGSLRVYPARAHAGATQHGARRTGGTMCREFLPFLMHDAAAPVSERDECMGRSPVITHTRYRYPARAGPSRVRGAVWIGECPTKYTSHSFQRFLVTWCRAASSPCTPPALPAPGANSRGTPPAWPSHAS
jgi:hypothetical protein